MTSDGTWNYSYDNEGNITQKTKISDGSYWKYSYDLKNELTEADQYNSSNVLQQSVAFKYDAFGNRIEKDVTVGSTTTTQRYALDGWEPAKAGSPGNAAWDVWADLDGNNHLTTRYFRGDVVDQLFARIDSGTSYWELTDRQGSIRTIIDNSATVKDQISYDGWGNASQTASTYGGRYLYTGREFDVETGLQYNRTRYYDPTTSRWISQDPRGFDAGDSDLYRYVNNSQTASADPSGLDRYYIRYHAYHMAVGVDTWEFSNWRWVKKGQVTFHFSAVCSNDVPALLKPVAALNYVIGSFLVARGIVTAEDGLPAGQPITAFRSSPAQDRQMLARIIEESKDPMFFNVVANNCITFALRALHWGKNAKGEPIPNNRIPGKVFAEIGKDIFDNDCRAKDVFRYVQGLVILGKDGKALSADIDPNKTYRP
jgi:RHS repeat-associated protein